MKKKICVIGASGLVGSHIVKEALERNYFVNGTVTKSINDESYKGLSSLKNYNNLNLFSSDMDQIDSLNDPFSDCDVIYVACLIPIFKGIDGTLANHLTMEEGYKQIILPTVKGCLNILQKAKDMKIKNVIICSSTSSVNPSYKVEVKNEVIHWSDEVEQCNKKKFTSAAKTYMEKAAFEFCKINKIRLSIILPTGLYGSLILKKHMKHNPFKWIKNALEGGYPRHEVIPNDSISYINLDDLSKMFLLCYENESASGRYFGVNESLHWYDIYEKCKFIIPNMKFPKKFSGVKSIPTKFDFSKRDSLGIKLKNFDITINQTVDCVKKI